MSLFSHVEQFWCHSTLRAELCYQYPNLSFYSILLNTLRLPNSIIMAKWKPLVSVFSLYWLLYRGHQSTRNQTRRDLWALPPSVVAVKGVLVDLLSMERRQTLKFTPCMPPSLILSAQRFCYRCSGLEGSRPDPMHVACSCLNAK